MSITANVQDTEHALSPTKRDVVILGAGPYGLSVAAHLAERGLKIAIFGKPLQLWREHMPEGMFLRSYWWATNLADPQRHYSFEKYFQEHGKRGHDPLSRETFVKYGLWFQQHAVPQVDETYVEHITRQNDFFFVKLVDGRVIQCRIVVMAPGLNYYVYQPDEYRHLGTHLVSHTSKFTNFQQFAAKKVVVIGGGQAALENAALLHESGANVQVVTRRNVRWLPADDTTQKRRLVDRIRRPQAGTGPGWLDWRLEHFPYEFWRMPRAKKDTMLRNTYTPAGAHWLRDRIEHKVELLEAQHVQKVQETDTGVELLLSNDQRVTAEHIMLGTGYHIDVKMLPMLDASLVNAIETYQDAPVLKQSFESSVPGLYFVGISAVSSFGPLFRFVIGAKPASQQVTRSVTRALSHVK